MASDDIALMAHLMRRAGFGASREELEAQAARGYEATVEELVNPAAEPVDRLEFLRYFPGFVKPVTSPGMGHAAWFHTMLNTRRPLEEKMVLFWHHIFATGQSKIDNWHELINQVDMFRQRALGNYRDLLIDLAKNPAMIYWLDNCDNHGHAVNENWGRELLELFSMGVGNYTEDDVRQASRAFTGWTIAQSPPRAYYHRYDWQFEYVPEDHDEGEKSFLGHSGNFNGEDIIDIVCQQPATARFVTRHLYNFFVADEVQVPAWQVTAPRDPQAIDTLAAAFIQSKGDMKPVLHTLFLSDFFKNARFARVKSPAEVVVGVLRLAGGCERPFPGFGNLSKVPGYMGQDLLNPPSVEGWHGGVEWINSGTLMKRVNFASETLGDINRPGIRAIINRLQQQGELGPEGLVDSCMDLLGPLEVKAETRQQLVDHAQEGGALRWSTQQEVDLSSRKVGEMLQLIASTREYQYC